MEDAQDSDLLAEFVSESLRGLQNVEQDLLSLESTSECDVELVNRIFRAVHSIKGSGAFLKLDNLVKVSHQAETLLDDIRGGRRSPNADLTDAILGAVDALVSMLQEPDQGASYNCQAIFTRLAAILNNQIADVRRHEPEQIDLQPAHAEEVLAIADSEAAIDPELLGQFLSESLQGLRDIEQDLLELENEGGSDRELVNRIFRTIHSIKGAACFFRFENLVAVAHGAETILDLIRSGQTEASPPVTDAVLAVVDCITEMLQEKDFGASHDCTAVLQKLDGVLNPDCTIEDGGADVINADAALLLNLKGVVYPIYRLTVDLESLHSAVDLKEGVVEGLNSVGIVHHASIPISDIDTTLSGTCIIYFETMLSPDILSSHLQIDERSIQLVDLEQLKKKLSKSSKENTKLEDCAKVSARVSAKNPESPVVTKVESSEKSTGLQTPKTLADKSTSGSQAITSESKLNLKTVSNSASNAMAPTANRSADEQTMRVPARILHELLEWTGNMVMARNQLLNEYDFRESNAFRTLSQAITGVHETVIETRMQTTGSLFERYRRVVRDLSRQLKKEVAFHIEGGDLELDRTILESFADPLTHLVRNCIDHALEPAEERIANGKNRQGNVYLRSYVQSGEIILEVQDDGRGISANYVCEKAISKGIITESEAKGLSEDQRVMLIFEAGFSTKDQATDVSGRGVGMDVVRNNIESVGGTIDLKTRVGEGSTFAARLPLAKALVSSSLTTALVIAIEQECLAIPETAISEIIQYDQRAIEHVRHVDGRCVYQHRDKLVALIDLRSPLGLEISEEFQGKRAANAIPIVRSKRSCLVIIQFRDQLFGTVVDEVIGMQEIIVRSNPQLIQECTVYSGHTVLGNGRIALILDINGIVNKMALKFQSHTDANKSGAQKDACATQKMLIFNNADKEYFAIPIELVAFIERISNKDILLVGEREFCQLKSETLSIVRLEKFLPVTPLNRSRNDICLIRPAAVEHPIGVITGSDLAVVDVAETFETRLDDSSGIVGTFYFNSNLVMLLDLFCVLEKHAPEKLKQSDDSTHQARILIAEDSLFFRKLIAQYVQRDEWEIEIVNDGLEAYERLINEPNRFDLVISDINMPRMDGFELVQKIREDKRFDGLPMVALTTMSDEHFREKGLRLGFDRYVVKIDKREVRSTVSECLRIKRSRT